MRLRIGEDTLHDLLETLSAAAQRLDARSADQGAGTEADAPGELERGYRH